MLAAMSRGGAESRRPQRTFRNGSYRALVLSLSDRLSGITPATYIGSVCVSFSLRVSASPRFVTAGARHRGTEDLVCDAQHSAAVCNALGRHFGLPPRAWSSPWPVAPSPSISRFVIRAPRSFAPEEALSSHPQANRPKSAHFASIVRVAWGGTAIAIAGGAGTVAADLRPSRPAVTRTLGDRRREGCGAPSTTR